MCIVSLNLVRPSDEIDVYSDLLLALSIARNSTLHLLRLSGRRPLVVKVLRCILYFNSKIVSLSTGFKGILIHFQGTVLN